MISAIGGNNSLQMMSALNAFKADSSTNKDTAGSFADLNTSSGINLADNNTLLNQIDVGDVKNYAQQIGEMHLTDDDIKYGLTYGRSVIADYLA